ncbi:ABC transporter permease [Ruminococcus sp.]|uniref:ABC transporter permease n=1 Tax=Ruminococcus sp. TaxID=41978 RepID=UPI0025DD41EE|nr:ABC transporter permease [Ruminococcus sp.]
MGGLVLHNLKKAKGQFISFGIVMIITAVILNISLVLLFQTGDAYDKRFDELNTADISASVPAALASEELAGDIGQINGVSAVEKNEALFASAALQEFQGSEFTMNTYFYKLSDERTISKHTIEEKASSEEENGAYIPMYLSALGGYKTGEKIRYITDGREYAFTVNGIISEMQYGNYGTGFIGIYLTDKAYEDMTSDENFTAVSEYLIKTDNDTDISGLKSDIAALLKGKNIHVVSLLDRDTAKNSRTMVSNTIVLFLAVFALLVLIVSIFLARFRIRTTIDEEINEMGVLKGIGYTSRQLMFSQVIPYGLICGAGLIIGTAISYTVIPSVANLLAVQSGFSYTPVFDIKAACISISGILVFVLLFTLLAAGKIKHLEPINAIRGIDPLKPADRNSFPLDTSKGSVALNLTLKQAVSSAGRNILLFAVTFVMMILLSFTGVLVYNVNIRPENFLTTLSEELPDIRVQSDGNYFEELKELLKNENVKAVNYGIANGEYTDGSLPMIVCEDYSLLENDICYKGAHPDNADKIAIGSAFEDDYSVGDKFRLTVNGNSHDYTVSGFIQSVNNNGLIAELTDEGYASISDKPLYSFNIYTNGRDIEDLVDKLNSEYSDYTVNISNTAKETKAMQAMYSSLITIVAILLFIITVLIILLILYVIMRSMISSLKIDFGIYKAMGFTSRQLIVQTVGSITPVVLIGSVLSAMLGIAYLPTMFDGIFSAIGAQKNNFEIPVAVLLIMALILTAVNIIIGTLLCRPIKRITAYSLIKEG